MLMNDSIKRVQSQAGLSFAERENQRSAAGGKANLRPEVKQKDFMKSAGRRGYSPLARVMTLAVMLFTLATTGAWATGTTVKYALNVGDSFTSGQTVEVKNGEDVVATITYGGTGGNVFKPATSSSQVSGYTAYTSGNGTNGNNAKGTFYTIAPKFDGTITVAVFLSAGKSFYVEEDGTALTDYNGITKESAYYGTFSFDVTKDKSYKFYCAGAKLGFYGFEYTYGGGSEPEQQPGKYTVTMAAEAGEGWTIEPAEATTTGVDKDTKITATYSGTKHVKSVTAVTKAAAPAVSYDKTVSINDGAVTVTAGEHWLITGTGTATSNQITIGDGATVTLDGVTINSTNSAGITCEGGATIILSGTNAVTGAQNYPGIQAGSTGTTLTIQGDGSLTATGGSSGAGIGGGYQIACGNITISGGTVTATGKANGAGIGSGQNASCGNITISGGTVTATGGFAGAGIGSGYGSGAMCGDITITSGVTSVTATKGSGSGGNAANSIGKGGGTSSCGTVTIEDGANVTQN